MGAVAPGRQCPRAESQAAAPVNGSSTPAPPAGAGTGAANECRQWRRADRSQAHLPPPRAPMQVTEDERNLLAELFPRG